MMGFVLKTMDCLGTVVYDEVTAQRIEQVRQQNRDLFSACFPDRFPGWFSGQSLGWFCLRFCFVSQALTNYSEGKGPSYLT